MVGAVLGSETEFIFVDDVVDGCKVGEGDADDYVTLGCGGCEGGVDLLGELDTFGQGGVHLPVACNDVFSHFYLKLEYCVIAFPRQN